jgi:hypothetical protein
MKQAFFLIAFLMLKVGVSAQSPATNPKMDEIIAVLEGTEFIQDYKAYRDSTEAKVLELKLNDNWNAAEIGKVKIAYKQSKNKFDAIWSQLKRDLTNPATRKMLKKSPDRFVGSYQVNLDAAKKYCNNNFHVKADDLLKKDGLSIDDLKILVGTFFELFNTFRSNQATNETFNAAYLDEKLIQPLRFKVWDKVE